MSGISLLVDTNIIIYHLKGRHEAMSLILNNRICISYISAIETLGYHLNNERDIHNIRALLSTFRIVYGNEQIMNSAISFRRKHKMKTPDSLIAATAKYLDLPLVSGDEDMFDLEEVDTIQFFI